MSQLFTLKWENHVHNVIDNFKNLLSTEEMVDVTLACEGHYIKAHKIILSACSPFFHSLFLEIPCKHPIVIFKDVRYTELKALIEFMYRGEVDVAQDNLSVFIEAAQTLQMKGLMDSTNEDVSPRSQEQPSLKTVRKRTRVRSRKGSLGDQSNKNASEPKIKPPPLCETEALSRDMQTQKSEDSDAESTTLIPPRSSPNIDFFQSQYRHQEKKQVLGQGDKQNFLVEENVTVMSQKSFEKQSNDVSLPIRSDMSSIQSNIPSTETQDVSSNSKELSARFVSTSVRSILADPVEHLESPCVKTEPLELLSSETLVEPLHDRDHGTTVQFLNQTRSLDVPKPTTCPDNSIRLLRQCQAHDNDTGASEVDAKTLSSLSPEYKETNLKGLKQRCCSYCSYSTIHSSKLKKHIRTHTAERPYTCSDCTKKFINKWDVARHMIVHTGEKPHECHYCYKKFNNKSSLRRHMKIHNREPILQQEI